MPTLAEGPRDGCAGAVGEGLGDEVDVAVGAEDVGEGVAEVVL